MRSLATTMAAASRLPGINAFNVLEKRRPIPSTSATRRSEDVRNAAGYSMLPFSGPITTGAPSVCISDGSRGDTGIGWCTTSMPCSRTSSRASRRCDTWVTRRDTKPVVM